MVRNKKRFYIKIFTWFYNELEISWLIFLCSEFFSFLLDKYPCGVYNKDTLQGYKGGFLNGAEKLLLRRKAHRAE